MHINAAESSAARVQEKTPMIRFLRPLLAATSAAAAMSAAGPSAALAISFQPTDGPLPIGQVMIADFDSAVAAGFQFVEGPNTFVRSGALGLDPGVSAPPPGDTSNHFTITKGGFATLTATKALGAFSFFLGSPDTFNSVTFSGEGFSFTLAGDEIWGGAPAGATGDQSIGRRVIYDFEGQAVKAITFASSGNAFEFDGLVGAYAAVPEPAAWAMMLIGFGGAGVILRRRRAVPRFA